MDTNIRIRRFLAAAAVAGFYAVTTSVPAIAKDGGYTLDKDMEFLAVAENIHGDKLMIDGNNKVLMVNS